jgi:hypothetical protein
LDCDNDLRQPSNGEWLIVVQEELQNQVEPSFYEARERAHEVKLNSTKKTVVRLTEIVRSLALVVIVLVAVVVVLAKLEYDQQDASTCSPPG